jgi:multisubunit Na+/H+ antiporter MnhE subunit
MWFNFKVLIGGFVFPFIIILLDRKVFFLFLSLKIIHMKKIYFAILSGLFFTQISNAQLILTKAANEPVIGDVNNSSRWDSTATLDNNTGPNTFWDFSSITSNTSSSTSNYTTVAGTPSASTYPNATFAEDLGGGAFNYWKSTSSPTTQLELLGIAQASLSFNLNANSAIAYIWPIAFGYNKTDAFSGAVSAQTPSGTVNGTATGTALTIASGTGTLLLPGAITFTNVLQITSTQTINASLAFGFITATIVSKSCQYYHGTQKFPILTVNYQDISGAFSGSSGTIRINNSIYTGIREASLNSDFSLYPNPATDKLNVVLTNKKAESVSVKVFNNLGQLVKTAQLGTATDINNQIDLTGLSSGIYVVKTTVGNASSSKKLIIQ